MLLPVLNHELGPHPTRENSMRYPLLTLTSTLTGLDTLISKGHVSSRSHKTVKVSHHVNLNKHAFDGKPRVLSGGVKRQEYPGPLPRTSAPESRLSFWDEQSVALAAYEPQREIL